MKNIMKKRLFLVATAMIALSAAAAAGIALQSGDGTASAAPPP